MSDPKKDEKERKGGGILPWASGAAKVPPTPGLTLASSAAKIGGLTGGKLGGLGAAAAIQAKMVAAAKIGLGLALVSGIGMSGYGLYDMGKRGGFGQDPNAPRPGEVKLFDKRASAPNLERGIYGGSSAPSSLGLAHKANKGAFDASEEEDAESADAVADDEFADEDVEESDEGAAGGADPAAMAEQMAAGMMGGAGEAGGNAKEAFGSRFGKLSSGLGGGSSGASLAGGSGLAGGIGKGFGRGTKLSDSQADKLRALSKGRKASRTRRKMASRDRGKNIKFQGRSLRNARRLSGMQGTMSSAGSNPETAAAAHSGEWDNAGGSPEGVAGSGASGIGDGGGGGFSGDEGGGGGTPVEPGMGGGGGGGGNVSFCDENPSHAACGGDPCSEGGCDNMTPYQGLVDLAMTLHFIVTALLAVLAILAWGKWLTPGVAEMLLKIIIGLSVVEALLGLGIMMFGQGAQGGLFTAIGSLMAIAAWISYAGVSGAETILKPGTLALQAGIATIVQGALGATAGFGTGDHQAYGDGEGE